MREESIPDDSLLRSIFSLTSRRWLWSVGTVSALVPGAVANVAAQSVVGPGTVPGFTVSSGTTSVIGSTTVAGSGTAIFVTGGALVMDPNAGASPGAISASATAFNAFAIYATGGTMSLLSGPGGITLKTSGNASAALWTQNTGVNFVSQGGLTITTSGGNGTVNGLSVGSFGAVASHNSSISLTGASITTTGPGAAAAYAYGSTMTLTNVTMQTSGNAAVDASGTYGAYGGISAVLNNIRGSLTVNGGSITTAGNTAYGLFALQGDITATGTSVTTNGTSAYAVFGRNASVISGTNLTVLATGSGGYGAYAATGSTINLSGGSVTTTGASGYGLLSYGAGSRLNATNVTTSTQNSSAPGATAWGTTATDDVRLALTGGSVTTNGQGSHGLYVRGNLAQMSVDGTSVTTSGASTFAARVINGSLSTNNSSIVANGTNATALGISSDAGVTANVSLTGGTLHSAQSDAIAVNGGTANITINGTTVSGAPNWLHTIGAASVAADPLLGPDAVTTVSSDNAAVPASVGVNVTGGVGITPTAGLTSVATVVANGATLTGTATTDADTTTTVTLAQNSVWNMTGNSTLTSLTNDASRVLFTAPSAGAYKTLTVTNYAGVNGLIGLNTYLGSDGAPSDKLVIDGGSATGTTRLSIANTGGPGALTVSNGILVVDAINGGTTQASAFSLASRVLAGPYEYRLYRGAQGSGSVDSWYLRSEQQPEPPAPPDPDPPPDPSPPPSPRPLYRPEVASYLANQRVAMQMFVHTLHDRLGEPQYVEGQGFRSADGSSDAARSAWLRVVGQRERSTSQSGDFDVRTNSVLLNLGGDIAKWSLFTDTDRVHLGLMGSYGSATTDATAAGNPATSRGKVNGWLMGLYGTWYQNDANKLGLYVDTWFQYGWFNSKVEGDTLPDVSYNAHGWAVSGEAGYAIPIRAGWIIEPQAQIINVSYSESGLTEVNGTAVTAASRSSVITRLGARFYRTFVRDDDRKVQPFIGFNWWHNNNGSGIAFDGIEMGNLYPLNRYEVKLGVNADLGKRWTGWTNVSGAWGSQNYSQYALRAGFKYTW